MNPRPAPVRPIVAIMSAAREEATAARHGYVGLEHLLLALAGGDAGDLPALLAEFEVTLPRARAAVRFVVSTGRGDGPRLDAAALLATLGIDLDAIRRQVDRRFGPNALHDLYSGPVGWNLRPRGPLCDVPLSPELTRTLTQVLGHCWDYAPPQLAERLLLAALGRPSPGLAAVLDTLAIDGSALRRALGRRVPTAS
jgi:ATP-dependent Clp protease ATP-binding subunit ClpA